jgi:hypothetical protein
MNKWERKNISRSVSVGNNAREKSHKKLERWIESKEKKREK